MTSMEELLLRRILNGELHVCHHTLDVSIKHRGRNQWLTKTPNQHPESDRYRLAFKHPESKNAVTVYRNRLVWMYFNRRLPNGVIDHKDGDRLNDHPSNLQEQSYLESNRQGAVVQQQNIDLGPAGEFFEHIARWGEEPINADLPETLEYAASGDTETRPGPFGSPDE